MKLELTFLTLALLFMFGCKLNDHGSPLTAERGGDGSIDSVSHLSLEFLDKEFREGLEKHLVQNDSDMVPHNLGKEYYLVLDATGPTTRLGNEPVQNAMFNAAAVYAIYSGDYEVTP